MKRQNENVTTSVGVRNWDQVLVARYRLMFYTLRDKVDFSKGQINCLSNEVAELSSSVAGLVKLAKLCVLGGKTAFVPKRRRSDNFSQSCYTKGCFGPLIQQKVGLHCGEVYFIS